MKVKIKTKGGDKLKLKNFNITDELNKDLRDVARITGKGEGAIIRQLLNRKLQYYLPNNLNAATDCGKELRKFILKKYRNKCADCRKEIEYKPHYQLYVHNMGKLKGVESTRKSLHIHHKDKNTENNLPSNLELLCPTCHKKAHKEMNLRKKR